MRSAVNDNLKNCRAGRNHGRTVEFDSAFSGLQYFELSTVDVQPHLYLGRMARG